MRFEMLSRKQRLSKPTAIGLMVIAAFGLFDATLLTVEHYQNITLPCNVTHGCELVLSSKYAEVFGVPIALFGVLFYLGILALSYFGYHEAIDLRLLLIPTLLGALSSLGLLYIQGGILHAWCQYCILSAISSLSLFVLVSYVVFKRKEPVHE